MGSQLLQVVEDYARAEGLSEVRLHNNEAMSGNLEYCPHRGYRETHRCVQNGFSRGFFTKFVDREQNQEPSGSRTVTGCANRAAASHCRPRRGAGAQAFELLI